MGPGKTPRGDLEYLFVKSTIRSGSNVVLCAENGATAVEKYRKMVADFKCTEEVTLITLWEGIRGLDERIRSSLDLTLERGDYVRYNCERVLATSNHLHATL